MVGNSNVIIITVLVTTNKYFSLFYPFFISIFFIFLFNLLLNWHLLKYASNINNDDNNNVHRFPYAFFVWRMFFCTINLYWKIFIRTKGMLNVIDRNDNKIWLLTWPHVYLLSIQSLSVFLTVFPNFWFLRNFEWGFFNSNFHIVTICRHDSVF